MALARTAWSRESVASASSRVAWNGRGSIRAISSPFFSVCPSLKTTSSSAPDTWTRMVAVFSACTVPSPSRTMGTSCTLTEASVTGTAGVASAIAETALDRRRDVTVAESFIPIPMCSRPVMMDRTMVRR